MQAQSRARELSWQAIQSIVGVKLSVDVLRFDELGWHRSDDVDSDVEIVEDDGGPATTEDVDMDCADESNEENDDDDDDEEPPSIDDYLEVTLSTDLDVLEEEAPAPADCPRSPDNIQTAGIGTAEDPSEGANGKDAKKSSPIRAHGCHVCVEKFPSYWELRKHINTHFPGMLDSKSSFCHLCQKDYTKTGFMNHLRKHTGERPFVCELCRKAFSQSSSLSIHMKFHLNVRKHACTVCEKKFVTKSELSRHMTVHTKQKSYYCGVCEKAFTRSDNMKKHEKTHG